MPRKEKKTADAAPTDPQPLPDAESLSPAELAKRHLEDALKRKREAQAGMAGHGTGIAKGNQPHHQSGPAKGRNFRHQGR